MSGLITGERFAAFVLGYRRSAFRLERQERYREPEEDEPLRRFLAGEPDFAWNAEWAAMMRRRTADGARMTRVRVICEPPDDYARFLLDLARVNVAAGEDIRYLPRSQADRLDLPDHDFWLIDDQAVAILRFGPDLALLGAEIHDDLPTAARHRRWRDVALEHAVPFTEYAG